MLLELTSSDLDNLLDDLDTEDAPNDTWTVPQSMAALGMTPTLWVRARESHRFLKHALKKGKTDTIVKAVALLAQEEKQLSGAMPRLRKRDRSA